jgi:putative MFS transporter
MSDDGSHPGEPASEPADDSGVERSNFFLRLFFGSEATIGKQPMSMLRLVALGMAFESYDIGLVNAALKQIAESIEMSTSDTGYVMAGVRLGGLGVLLMIPLADILGRRRMFLAALIGMSLGTFLTAFAQTQAQFMLIQMVTRAFMLTGAALSVVILVEEFPADQRGSALGLMSVLGGMGYGLGAGLYAAVDALPYGWRSLYALGIVPLLMLPMFRRSLRETRRFAEHARERSPTLGSISSFLSPIRELAATHPRRLATVGLAGFFGAMGSIAVFQYTSFFVQQAHGWAPGQYSMLVLGGGFIGMFGNIVGGRGSDRFGRRRVGCAMLTLAPAFAILFFNGPSWTLVLSWGLFVLCMSAADVVIRAQSTELFPTSQRGTSGGALIAVQSIGFFIGLALFGFGTGAEGDLSEVVSWVSLSTVAAAICLLFLPETHQRELESISASPVDADHAVR